MATCFCWSSGDRKGDSHRASAPERPFTVLSQAALRSPYSHDAKEPGTWLLLNIAADLGIIQWCWFYWHIENKGYGAMEASTRF